MFINLTILFSCKIDFNLNKITTSGDHSFTIPVGSSGACR